MDETKAPARGTGNRSARAVMLLVLMTLVGGAAGFEIGYVASNRFTAEATVLVSPLEGNPYSPNGNGQDLANLETEAQLAASDAVADIASDNVQATSRAGLLSGLEVTVPPNTQIVVISYTARTAALARQRAQGFADAYLAFRVKRAEGIVTNRVEGIQEELATQTARLDRLLARRGATTVRVRRAILQEQINGTTKQIGKLNTSLTNARTTVGDPGQVISPARATGRDPRLVRALGTAVGALVALAVGVVLLLQSARTRRASGSRPSASDQPLERLPADPTPVTEPPVPASVGRRHDA